MQYCKHRYDSDNVLRFSAKIFLLVIGICSEDPDKKFRARLHLEVLPTA